LESKCITRESELTLPQQPDIGLDAGALVVGVVDELDTVEAFHHVDCTICRDIVGRS